MWFSEKCRVKLRPVLDGVDRLTIAMGGTSAAEHLTGLAAPAATGRTRAARHALSARRHPICEAVTAQVNAE